MTSQVVERLTQQLHGLTAARRSGEATGLSVDARIRELEQVLANAEVGSKPDDGLVEPGMVVTVTFDADDATHTFLVGSRALLAADPTITIDVYSPVSPLGAAIIGAYVGETVSYRLPNESVVSVEIIEAEPFAG